MVLRLIESELDQEAIDAVKHYVEHDEYEMAFEGLFLEIIKLNEVPNLNFAESKKVAIMLRLHESSVFDADFWTKFNQLRDNAEGLAPESVS